MLNDIISSKFGAFAIDNNLIDLVSFVFYLETVKMNEEIVSYDTQSHIRSSLKEIKNKKKYFEKLTDIDCKKIALIQYKNNKETLKDQRVTVSYHVPLSAILDNDFIYKMMSNDGLKTAFEIDKINFNLDSHDLFKKLLINIGKIKEYGGEIWLNDYIHTSKIRNYAIKKITFDLIKLDKRYWWIDGRFNELFLQIKKMKKKNIPIVVKGVESRFQRDLVNKLKTMSQSSL